MLPSQKLISIVKALDVFSVLIFALLCCVVRAKFNAMRLRHRLPSADLVNLHEQMTIATVQAYAAWLTALATRSSTQHVYTSGDATAAAIPASGAEAKSTTAAAMPIPQHPLLHAEMLRSIVLAQDSASAASAELVAAESDVLCAFAVLGRVDMLSVRSAFLFRRFLSNRNLPMIGYAVELINLSGVRLQGCGYLWVAPA